MPNKLEGLEESRKNDGICNATTAGGGAGRNNAK